ncbi:MAG: DUF2254 domain-containing protein [Rhodopseudomonas sp.]|nr:DUF2254 domain-containing protein [Rhodopseudomonas sp.]
MLTRLLTYWQRVRESLWALPLLIVLCAGGLAFIALNASYSNPSILVLFGGSNAQAPDFLSSLMTAMINMATLAVSITMVVLTLAAQQLGPRLIRSFMSNRQTQMSLGLFIGTVVYLLLVLRSAYGNQKIVPNIAVTGGTFLVLLSLIALLLFVHHLARSIVADNVVERVGQQLDRDIRRLCPDESDHITEATEIDRKGAAVVINNGGYVQAIDHPAIAAAAEKADVRVSLNLRAGHHIVAGVVAAYVTPKSRLTDEVKAAIQNAVLTGSERTTVQDLEYAARHLVEVALRALSPGINDVFTALAVINRLALSLRLMMRRGTPQSQWTDSNGHIRVVAPVSSFEGVTDAAFNQIRQNADGKAAVLIRMAESIGMLLQQADDAHRPALEKHLQLVLDAGNRDIPEKADLKDLEESVRQARAEIGEARA